MKKSNILSLILFVFGMIYLFYGIGIVIEHKSDDKSTDYWKNIDTTQVVGQLQDSCRCTIINDKLYRVKIKMVQQEIYQPYK